MTHDDHNTEWSYLYHERLGIIIDGTRPPTDEEDRQAREEANEIMETIENGKANE